MPASTRLPELRTADLPAGRRTWREEGSGPALVLVHGIGGHSASWRPQFASFRDRFRVIAWDAPGYGGSTPLAGAGGDASAYAAALLELLDHLGVASAHLVGHSLGAVFVAALCRLRPSLAQKVVFVHPVTGAGGLPAEQREAVRAARIADLTGMGARRFAESRGRAILGSVAAPESVAEAIAVMAEAPEEGYLAAWDAMCAADINADLDCVRGPVLVVSGGEDPVSPPATGAAIAARLPTAEQKVLDGIGHYASLEAPDRLDPILREFLARA